MPEDNPVYGANGPHNPQAGVPADQQPTRELTYGEKAVGITFNPGRNPEVEAVKRRFAEHIDFLDTARSLATSSEAKRLYSIAITEAQAAQMWAVKAVTFEH